jgi:hypothetical protein
LSSGISFSYNVVSFPGLKHISSGNIFCIFPSTVLACRFQSFGQWYFIFV